jgi:hypothetical protein
MVSAVISLSARARAVIEDRSLVILVVPFCPLEIVTGIYLARISVLAPCPISRITLLEPFISFLSIGSDSSGP